MRRIAIFKNIIIISVISISFFIFTRPGNAAALPGGISFRFQPATVVVNVSQGKSFKDDVSIENNSKDILKAKLYVTNFKAENGGTTVSFYQPSDNAYNMAKWIIPEEETITINPNDQQYETLDITIPDYVKSGTYTGELFVEPANSSSDVYNGSVITARAGINLIVNVAKNVNEYTSLYKGTTIENLSTSLLNLSNVSLFGDIKNPGKFVISNNVDVNIYTIFGKKAKTYSFKGIDVLPGQYRFLSGSGNQINIKGLSLGFYKADIVLKDNLKETSTTRSVYFTLTPAYFIIISLLGILLISFTVYAIRRR